MADGTKINMQCNPALNSAVRFSGRKQQRM